MHKMALLPTKKNRQGKLQHGRNQTFYCCVFSTQIIISINYMQWTVVPSSDFQQYRRTQLMRHC